MLLVSVNLAEGGELWRPLRISGPLGGLGGPCKASGEMAPGSCESQNPDLGGSVVQGRGERRRDGGRGEKCIGKRKPNEPPLYPKC